MADVGFEVGEPERLAFGVAVTDGPEGAGAGCPFGAKGFAVEELDGVGLLVGELVGVDVIDKLEGIKVDGVSVCPAGIFEYGKIVGVADMGFEAGEPEGMATTGAMEGTTYSYL